MATVNMNSDILGTINDIYKKKEAACEVSNLLGNLKLSTGWTNGSRRELATIEYDSAGNRKFINTSEVPDELRKRLIQCADDYYDEMLKMFESISVSGECFASWEESGDDV